MSCKLFQPLNLIASLAALTAAWSSYLPAVGQTRYEWVPGSRQARVVPANAVPVQAGQQYYSTRRPIVPAAAPAVGQTGIVRPTAASAATSSNSPATSSNSAAASSNSQAVQKGHIYHYVDQVSVDGVPRQFQVHVPPGYDRSRPIPVVLIFHGLHMNSTMMVGMTGFNPVADRNNFVAVYGDGINNRWYDGRRSSGADDIAYVNALLAKLAKTINVDQRRIYACGISNGGFFTQALACSMPDRIAAAGVVASSMMDGTQSLMQGSKAVPIAFFLGTDDPLLPWGDGRTKDIGKLGEALGLGAIGSIDGGLARYGGLLNVPETINFWISHNHATTSPQITWEQDRDPRDGTKVKKETYGSSGNQVVLYSIEGGGHTWPGCPNLKAISGLSGNICQDIDASTALWEFFKFHSR